MKQSKEPEGVPELFDSTHYGPFKVVLGEGFGIADGVSLNGIADEFSVGMDVKSLHDPVLVESDGAWSQIEDAGDFLHRLPLGQ